MKAREYMISLESLREYGADVETGMKRCMGNEALYLRLVSSIASESGFDKLKETLEQNDLHAAFEAAHALKGVLGNLSLTPLYDTASEITELLRAEKDMDYGPLLEKLILKRDELTDLLS